MNFRHYVSHFTKLHDRQVIANRKSQSGWTMNIIKKTLKINFTFGNVSYMSPYQRQLIRIRTSSVSLTLSLALFII